MLRIASIKEIDAAPGAAALPEEQVVAVVAAVLESELAVWKRAAAAEACGIRGFRLGL